MKHRVNGAGDQRPEDQGKADQCDRCCGPDQIEGLVIHPENRAEQKALQRHRRSGGGQDKDAKRQRDQIERCQAGILADDGEARQQAGQQRYRNAGAKPADDHRGHRQPGDDEANDNAGNNGMGHRLAGKRQSTQHQKGTNRRNRTAEHTGGSQRPDHEIIGQPVKHRPPPPCRRHCRHCRQTWPAARPPDLASDNPAQPDSPG